MSATITENRNNKADHLYSSLGLYANTQTQKWSRIVLFHAVEHPDPILLWGEPTEPLIDVGLAMASVPPKEVKVRVWSMVQAGDDDAEPTEEILTVKRLFGPVDTWKPKQYKAGAEEAVSSRCVRE
jgi:hypothetical protein